MALNLALQGACDALRIGANEVLRENNNFAQPVGLGQALRDPANANAVKTQFEGGQTGQYKQVDLYYMQRGLEAEVRTTKTCDPGSSEPRRKQNTFIQLYREVATTVAEDDIRVLCGNYSDFVDLNRSRSAGAAQLRVMREIAEQLYNKEDALATSINKALNVAFAAEVGKYMGGATTNTYTMVRADNYALILKGIIDMGHDLEDIGFSGNPYVVGNGIIRKAMRAGDYGCCNDLGQDFGVMRDNPGFNYYRDEHTGIATVLNNANGFFAWAPGTAQFLTYNQYVGNYAGEMIGADVVRGTIPSTYFPGVNYDVRIFADGCAETYKVIMGLWFDLWTFPADMFKVGDRLSGVTGTVKGIAAAQVAA